MFPWRSKVFPAFFSTLHLSFTWSKKNPVYLDVVTEIFTAIDNGQITAVTSPVTLAECLVHPLRLNLPHLQQSFIDVVVSGSNTTFVTLDQSVGQQAARL